MEIISQDRTGGKDHFTEGQDRRQTALHKTGEEAESLTGQDRTGDMELFTAEDSRQRALHNTGQKAKSFIEQDRRQRAFHRAGQNRKQRAFRRTGKAPRIFSRKPLR